MKKKIKNITKRVLLVLCATFMFITLFQTLPVTKAQASTKSFASYIKEHGKKDGNKYTLSKKTDGNTVKLIYDSKKKTFTMKGTVKTDEFTEKIELSGITGDASKKVTSKLTMNFGESKITVSAKVQGSKFTGKGTKGISGLKWNMKAPIPESSQSYLKEQMVTLTDADLILVYTSFMMPNGFELSDIGFTKVKLETLINKFTT